MAPTTPRTMSHGLFTALMLARPSAARPRITTIPVTKRAEVMMDVLTDFVRGMSSDMPENSTLDSAITIMPVVMALGPAPRGVVCVTWGLFRSTPQRPVHVGAAGAARVDLPRPHDAEILPVIHLAPVGEPPGGAADGEQHREHVIGDPRGAKDEPGVEIHVGVEVARDEVVVVERNVLQPQGDVEEGIS